MKRSVALFPIVLALGAIIFAPRGGAQARDSREGPIKITQCQTISHPGSYELADNLPPIGPSENCLVITASFVSIDLAGFTITGPQGATGILAQGQLHGITVRNGSISSFGDGVNLSSADGSIVEGLRVNVIGLSFTGISANGIIKNNTVSGSRFYGITATGIVTGNYAFSNRIANIEVGPGSTVIGNTTTGSEIYGILVGCPSNVTDNTATGSSQNLVLQGEGCNNTNNVGP